MKVVSDISAQACNNIRGRTWRKKRNRVLLNDNEDKTTIEKKLLNRVNMAVNDYYDFAGQHIAVVARTTTSASLKVFGTKPLIDIIRKMRPEITRKLHSSMNICAPNRSHLFELPPLAVDGIVVPLHKMTQAQLRAFIPLMLKYSTGRGKPGWGKEELRPPWWPKNMPWANIRVDSRCEDEKRRVPWTYALRELIHNCYIFHGREDLLKQSDESYPFAYKRDSEFVANEDVAAPTSQEDDKQNELNMQVTQSTKSYYVRKSLELETPSCDLPCKMELANFVNIYPAYTDGINYYVQNTADNANVQQAVILKDTEMGDLHANVVICEEYTVMATLEDGDTVLVNGDVQIVEEQNFSQISVIELAEEQSKSVKKTDNLQIAINEADIILVNDEVAEVFVNNNTNNFTHGVVIKEINDAVTEEEEEIHETNGSN